MDKMEVRIAEGMISADVKYDGTTIFIWGNESGKTFSCEIPLKVFHALTKEIFYSTLGKCVFEGKVKLAVLQEKQ